MSSSNDSRIVLISPLLDIYHGDGEPFILTMQTAFTTIACTPQSSIFFQTFESRYHRSYPNLTQCLDPSHLSCFRRQCQLVSWTSESWFRSLLVRKHMGIYIQILGARTVRTYCSFSNVGQICSVIALVVPKLSISLCHQTLQGQVVSQD